MARPSRPGRRVAEWLAAGLGVLLATSATILALPASTDARGTAVPAAAAGPPVAPTAVVPIPRPSAPSSAAPSSAAPSSAAPSSARTPAAAPGRAAPTVRPRTTRLPAAPTPDAAVRVRVDGVEIDQDVVPVGLDPDGQLELPSRPSTVGWYRFGSWPGRSVGTVVLAAHVDSRRFGAGPLRELGATRVGAIVTVRTTAGRDVRYSVTSVGSIRKTALPTADLFARSGTARLALVTCSGPFDPDTRSYRDNQIVWALPEGG